MFRALPLPVIRSYLLYIRRWYIPWRFDYSFPDDGQRKCPKHVEFFEKIKYGKIVRLVGFTEKKFVATHDHMNLKLT